MRVGGISSEVRDFDFCGGLVVARNKTFCGFEAIVHSVCV